MAVVARDSTSVEIIVTEVRRALNSRQLEHNYTVFHKTVLRRDERLLRDRYNCCFSQDSNYVAVSSALGYLSIFDLKLNLKCKVCPQLFELANERSFDFDRRFFNRRIALATTDRIIYLFDIHEKTVIYKRRLVVACDTPPVSVQCIKYSRPGDVLAVALSDGDIHLLDPETLSCNFVLQGSSLASSVRLCVVNRTIAAAVAMSFDTFAERLAVSYTDGFVRVWQLPLNLELLHLCRKAVLRYTHLRDLKRLPLPKQIIDEIFPVVQDDINQTK